jgi:hypothetical protein
LVAVVAIVWVVWVGVRLVPWLMLPREPAEVIEKRWRTVERLATLPPPTGDDGLLLDAVDEIGGFAPPTTDEDVPVLDKDQLSEEQQHAVELLVKWRLGGAGYVPVGCSLETPRRSRASLRMFRLGQAALFTAHDGADIPQVEAVLSLARAQRRFGRTIDLAVGSKLAAIAAKWSRARGVAFPAEFSKYRPRVEEIRRALARNTVCIPQWLDGASPLQLDEGRMGADRPRPPLGIVRLERELLVFKQFHGKLLEQALSAGDDWEKIAAAYERADDNRPRSILLDFTVVLPSVIRKAGKNIAVYDENVKR